MEAKGRYSENIIKYMRLREGLDEDICVLREIWRNPAGWMYSYDGIQSEAAPMDIGKIHYFHALLRKEQRGKSPV